MPLWWGVAEELRPATTTVGPLGGNQMFGLDINIFVGIFLFLGRWCGW